MKKVMLSGLLLGVFCWAQERPRLLGISHIAVRVKNLDASRKFYTGLLGYQEAFTIRKDGTAVTGGGLSQSQAASIFFKVNNRQYIVLVPETSPDQARYVDAGIETDNAEAMRLFLKSLGYAVPDKVEKNATSDLSFHFKDPGGNSWEIIQYTPASLSVQNVGKFMNDERPAQRILHVGISPRNRQAVDFYFKAFALREFWRSDRTMFAPGRENNRPASDVSGPVLAGTTNAKLAESDDYLEFNLSAGQGAATATSANTKNGGRGSAAAGGGGGGHIALLVPDMAKAMAFVKAKPGWKDYPRAGQTEAHIGVNHKWQGNFFDPDGTRSEFMEPDTADGLPSPMSRASY